MLLPCINWRQKLSKKKTQVVEKKPKFGTKNASLSDFQVSEVPNGKNLSESFLRTTYTNGILLNKSN